MITPHRLVRFVRREELFAQLEGTCGAEWQQAASGQWPMGGCEMTNGYCAWVYKNNGSYNIIKYMYTLRIYIYNICILYIYDKVTQNNHLLQKIQDYPSAGVIFGSLSGWRL